MGQSEIIEWLRAKRKSGNNAYFSIGEVKEGIKNVSGGLLQINFDLRQLERFGIVEVKESKEFVLRREYRIKNKYLGKGR